MVNFLKKLFSKKVTLVTHNGKFHVDDVWACAAILLWLEKQHKAARIVRTRDEEIIKKGDIVFDVGTIYDPLTMRFDHHQKEGAGVRENGIPYAAFGLIWKHLGPELCGNDMTWKEIDSRIVQGIDAEDNGVKIVERIYPDVAPYDFGEIKSTFMPSWKEDELINKDDAFLEVVSLVKKLLKREISKTNDKVEAQSIVEEFYRDSADKRVIVLTKYYPWQDVLDSHPEPLFVIAQRSEGKDWMVNTIRTKPGSFDSRKNLPEAWGGLRDEELARISGVPDATFCHKGLFLAIAKTKEGALKLAEKALAM